MDQVQDVRKRSKVTYGASARYASNDIGILPDISPELLDVIDGPLPEVVVVG